jgi:hypothetical protein
MLSHLEEHCSARVAEIVQPGSGEPRTLEQGLEVSPQQNRSTTNRSKKLGELRMICSSRSLAIPLRTVTQVSSITSCDMRFSVGSIVSVSAVVLIVLLRVLNSRNPGYSPRNLTLIVLGFVLSTCIPQSVILK